jgi:hypothetical protein
VSAFTIMAHALAQELRARGLESAPAECEEILRRVVDRTAAVASERMPPGCAGPPCYCALTERPKGDCTAAKAQYDALPPRERV